MWLQTPRVCPYLRMIQSFFAFEAHVLVEDTKNTSPGHGFKGVWYFWVMIVESSTESAGSITDFLAESTQWSGRVGLGQVGQVIGSTGRGL